MKLGATKKESEVFLYLTKCRVSKEAKEIASKLRLHRGETYRILKSLQSKGIIESTIDRPMKYIAVSIEKILDLHIKALREKATSIEADKNEILTFFSSVTSDIPFADNEKFLILKRQEIISAKGDQMVHDAVKDIFFMVTNSKGLSYGQSEAKIQKGVKIHYLTNLNYEEAEKAKHFVDLAVKKGNVAESRCINIGENTPYRLLIQDDNNTMLIWKSKIGEEMIAFWTDSEVFIQVLRVFYEKLWNEATDFNIALRDLKKNR